MKNEARLSRESLVMGKVGTVVPSESLVAFRRAKERESHTRPK